MRIALDDLAVSMKRGCEACGEWGWAGSDPIGSRRGGLSSNVLPFLFPSPHYAGAETEPWVCLSCNGTRCSRYVQACNEAHFFETLGGGEGEDEEGRGPHCLALSLSDLSVWCYACNSYVKHDRLMPLLIRAEAV